MASIMEKYGNIRQPGRQHIAIRWTRCPCLKLYWGPISEPSFLDTLERKSSALVVGGSVIARAKSRGSWRACAGQVRDASDVVTSPKVNATASSPGERTPLPRSPKQLHCFDEPGSRELQM